MCKTTTLSEAQVREEFLALTPELDKWGATVDSILNDYLHSAFTSAEHRQNTPKHRVKAVESYCEKVLYRKPTAQPLLFTYDKVGTRVILLTREDVCNVSNFVAHCPKWEVVEKSRDYANEIFKEPELFAYQSDHFIVRPLDGYTSSADRQYLTCEIQIRTLMMHAYAEISHDTVYKKAAVDNPTAKRLLATAMALLESADEKFTQIYEEMNNMNTFYYSLQTTLIRLYLQCVPDYSSENYNVEFAMKILNIYTKDEQLQLANEIQGFYSHHASEIKSQIAHYKDQSVLFSHPVVLVALYGIMCLQSTTWSKWPYSYESIEAVVTAMNISMDSLR